MKRKVKFQEGGEVSGMTAAERRRAALEQAKQSRSFESQRRIARRVPASSSGDALRSGAGMTPRPSGSALSLRGPGLAGAGLATAAILPQLYDALRNRPRSQEDLDIAEAYRTGRDVREVRAAREAAAQPTQLAVTPDQMQTADVPGNRATSGAGAPAAARMREVDMQGGDVPGNVAMNPQARSQPSRRAAAPARRESVTADELNAMVLRLQSGVAPQTETERRLADGMGIAYRKGGLVAPKKYQEGGPVKVPGKTAGVGGPKPSARMRDRVSAEERKELDAPLTQAEKNRLRGDNFKKGGKVMAKKMKTGGKVPAPKKMMKGGITSKPKVKPVKYAKGGMTKGCK